MSNKIIDLFKTPLYITKIDLNYKSLASYCLSLQKKDKGRKISNVGGWQSGKLTHKTLGPLKPLLSSIKKEADKFTEQIGLKPMRGITSAWININDYKDSNQIHNHPHSVLSGVYYIKTPKDCGTIDFYHPAFDLLAYDWRNMVKKDFNNYNSHSWWQDSKPGLLYMFPGWIKHKVYPNLNKSESRISISFNLHSLDHFKYLLK